MGLIVDLPTYSVSVAGVPLPLGAVAQLSEALAPEVDACELMIPWGDCLTSGLVDPVAEALPAVGAAVVVTCGDYEWRGILTSRRRRAAGHRRYLAATAYGPGLAMDRSYLPTFARAGLSGVVQSPGGPRYAPGTRSGSAGGPGGTYYLGGSDIWTIHQALASYLAHAPEAGLPAIALDTHTASLGLDLPDVDTDGLSYLSGLQAICSHRLGFGWRPLITASGWVARCYGLSGSGVTVDLTQGNVTDYDVGDDGSAALADLEVRGGRRQYVISLDCYTSGSGDIRPWWSGGGSEMQYRRFQLQNVALPDGSSVLTAEPVASLPIAAASPVARGSTPWLCFAQRADSSWISLQGRVSIGISGSTVWVEGITAADWAEWTRLRFTLCLSPRSHLSTLRSGGAGLGRGLAIVGARHVHVDGASIGVSGGSLDTVSGTLANETSPITDQADALWTSLGSHQVVASWTRAGVWGGAPIPGQRVAGFLLPRPGSAPLEESRDCLCTSRVITRAGTTWMVRPMPYLQSALVRRGPA